MICWKDYAILIDVIKTKKFFYEVGSREKNSFGIACRLAHRKSLCGSESSKSNEL